MTNEFEQGGLDQFRSAHRGPHAPIVADRLKRGCGCGCGDGVREAFYFVPARAILSSAALVRRGRRCGDPREMERAWTGFECTSVSTCVS